MKKFVIQLIPIQKADNNADDPFGWYVEMPYRSRGLAANLVNGRDLVLTALTPQSSMNIRHPLILQKIGAVAQPRIGSSYGEYFGMVSPMPGIFVNVFQDLPWPTSALDTGGAS